MTRPATLLLLGALAAAAFPAAAQAPAPAAEPPAPVTRVSFTSGSDQSAPQPIWDAVTAYRPEVHVFAGDNVFGAAPREELSGSMRRLRDAYGAALRLEPFRRLREDARALAVWGGQDYGLVGGGADHPHREQAKELFLDFWEVPRDDPRHGREGLHHAEVFGPEGRRVQVVVLDTRWFRSAPKRAPDGTPGGPFVPDEDASATVLGDAQWAWLEEELRRPAEVRLIVSPMQVLAEGHGHERWGLFPRERRRLFDLIASTGAAGVVFLSGGRELGALYRAEEGVPYPLAEATAGGVNRASPDADEPGPNRIGALYGAENFGTVDIDWWARTVELSVRGMNGEAVRSVVLEMDRLRPRRRG